MESLRNLVYAPALDMPDQDGGGIRHHALAQQGHRTPMILLAGIGRIPLRLMRIIRVLVATLRAVQDLVKLRTYRGQLG